jgi:hypothetical protein
MLGCQVTVTVTGAFNLIRAAVLIARTAYALRPSNLKDMREDYRRHKAYAAEMERQRRDPVFIRKAAKQAQYFRVYLGCIVIVIIAIFAWAFVAALIHRP